MPNWAWRHATERLNFLIERGKRGLADPNAALRFTYVIKTPIRSPIELPGSYEGILLGPDGRPLKGHP